MRVPSVAQEDLLEEGTEIHSSILAWKNPMDREPGDLQSRVTKSLTWLKQLSMHERHSEEYLKHKCALKIALDTYIVEKLGSERESKLSRIQSLCSSNFPRIWISKYSSPESSRSLHCLSHPEDTGVYFHLQISEWPSLCTWQGPIWSRMLEWSSHLIIVVEVFRLAHEIMLLSFSALGTF